MSPPNLLGGTAERDELRFPTTTWSAVSSATPSERPTRLRELLVRCWRPVCASVRHTTGASLDVSRDVTQEFFVHMFKGGALERYDRGRARFRHFVKACLHHFLQKVRRDTYRRKRGGKVWTLSLDRLSPLGAPLLPTAADADPATVFDREWAAGLLDEGAGQLKRELAAEGRMTDYQAWELYVLSRDGTRRPTYAEVARELGLSESALRESLYRTRRRFKRILMSQVRPWVADERELFAEMDELFSARPSRWR